MSRIEDKLQQNSVKEVLSGMRRITGYETPHQVGEENKNRVNDLSLFLNGFIAETRPAAPTTPG